MRETFAGELIGKTIVIKALSPGSHPPRGYQMSLWVKETGMKIENVADLTITAKAGDITTAELTLVHITPFNKLRPEEEKVVVENPEIDLEALVTREVHYAQREIPE